MPSARTLLKYGVVVTGARGIPLVVLMVASVTVPAADFGSLASMVAAVTLCIGIAEGGLDSSASLLIGAGRTTSDVLASLTTVRSLLATLLAVTVLPALLIPLRLDHGGLVLAMAALALVAAAVAATSRVRIRAVSPRREARILTADRALSAAPMAVGLAFGAPVSALGLLFLGGQILGSLTTIGLVRPQRPGNLLSRELVREAMPFILSTVAANITWRVGVIGLGILGMVEQAGYLATAIYPVQAVTLVSAGSSVLILVGGRQGLKSLRIRASAILGLILATLLASGAVLLAGQFLSVNRGVVWTMAALLLVLPVALANPLVGAHLRVHGRAFIVAGAALGGAAVASAFAVTGVEAPVQAIGIVLAEGAVLTTMLLSSRCVTLRSRVETRA